MPLNLDQARRLHDRDPNNPARCAICHYIDGDDWPCATATALGATGASEWTGTTIGAGILAIPKIIEFDPRTEEVGPNGTIITRTDNPCTCGHARGTHKQDVLCRNCDCDTYQEDRPSPDCALNHPHAGHCTNPNDPDTYTPCGDTTGKYAHQPCILITEHWDQHVDHDGNRWEQETQA